jgi:hypothetical protein
VIRRVAAALGFPVLVMLLVAGCSESNPGGHAEEREVLAAIEIEGTASEVEITDRRDEVVAVFRPPPGFHPVDSITPPYGWQFVESFDRDEWLVEGVAAVYVYEGPGPSAEYSDCGFIVQVSDGDEPVEVHVNCVRTP